MESRDATSLYQRPYQIDEARGTITLWVWVDDEEQEINIPLEWDTCPTCGGSGRHVNPSIDSHGISSAEFAEDADFTEGDFRGSFDMTCAECNGRRVVPVSSHPRFIEACSEAWDAACETTRERLAVRDA